MEGKDNNLEKKFGDSYTYESVGGERGLLGIRSSPSWYLGNGAVRGARQMPTEILQNAVDEGAAKLSFMVENGGSLSEDNKFHVYIDIRLDDTVTILDTGRGVPPEIHPKYGVPTLEVLFEEINIGGKNKNFVDKSESAYKAPTIGTHGSGASCTNACSDFFEVTSYFQRTDKVYTARWEKAIKTNTTTEIGPANGQHGTLISFKPSKELFSMYDDKGIEVDRFYSFEWIDALLTEYAYNTTHMVFHLTFEQEEEYGGEIEKDYDSSLLTIPSRLGITDEKDLHTIDFINEDEGYSGSLYITTKGNKGQYSIVNMLRVRTGTHIEAIERTLDGIERGFYPIIQEQLDEEKLGIILEERTMNSLRVPRLKQLVGYYFTLNMESPSYSGQSKDKLDVPQILTSLSDKIKEEFDSTLFDIQRELIQILSTKVMTSAREYKYIQKHREEEEKKKDIKELTKKISQKNKKGKIIGANDNHSEYLRARDTKSKNVIVYVIEGRSAFNLFKVIRYPQNEAIYALNRRPINVFNYTTKQLTRNEKFKSLYELLSGVDGKSEYQAIVLSTDYDEDGGLLNLYMIAFIAMYFPNYILNGKLLLFESYKFMAIKEFEDENGETKADVKTFKDYDEAKQYADSTEGYTVRSFKGTGSIPKVILRGALDNIDNYTVLRSDNIEETREVLARLLTNTKYKQRMVLENYGSARLNTVYANQKLIMKMQDVDFDVNDLESGFVRERDMSKAINHTFTATSFDDLPEPEMFDPTVLMEDIELEDLQEMEELDDEKYDE